ncbi:MAG TPA: AMP-binding protein, partial [Prolixibacteraceae bacterium]|nr:AMP-binding protein [Prolixibacteraceae bacterium]
ILSTNMPNWGISFFAILRLGAIAVPILPDFHSNEIKTIAGHAEAKLLFVSEQLYYKVEKEDIPGLRGMILIDRMALIPQGTPVSGLSALVPAEAGDQVRMTVPEVHEEDLATIIYTSGTTGSSKGVMLTHKNITWTALQSLTIEPLTPDDRFLSILPLSHTYENTLGLLFPLFFGASVWYLRKPPIPPVLLPALQQVKPTKLLSVPLVIEKIFKGKVYPEFQKSPVVKTLYRFPPVRKILHRVAGKKLMKTFGGELTFFGVGGSKLDGTVERFLKEARFPYAIGYGLTETSPLLAGTSPRTPRIGSTGPALQGVKLRLADADPVTGEGEIQAQGPNVMMGYYKNPEVTAQVFTPDGWFRTGDLGSFDKDGFLRIKGRIKNTIVGASGENIYPEEIESVINRMRYVLESLVVEKKGKLVALIHLNMEEIERQYHSLRNDASLFADKISERKDEILRDIQEKVNAQVNKFSKLQQVFFQKDPFEKTPTQKIKRFLYHQKSEAREK